MPLTQQQIDTFHAEGFLVVEGALDDADLDPVIDEYETYIDRRADELYTQGKISDRYSSEPFARRLACICGENSDIYGELDIMRLLGKASFAFLGNDKLLDSVEQFVGPEITCSPIQHLRPKLPTALAPGQNAELTHIAPWHQDAGVTWPEADPYFILTVWVPLVDATPENGCMEIIPRVHGGGLREHLTYSETGTTIVTEQMPKTEPLPLPMHKGDVLFMHKAIPHRSLPNRSDTVRWSMDLRYQQTGTPTGRPVSPRIRGAQPRRTRFRAARPRRVGAALADGPGTKPGRAATPLATGVLTAMRVQAACLPAPARSRLSYRYRRTGSGAGR